MMFVLALLSVLSSARLDFEEKVAWWSRRRRHKPNAYTGGQNIGEQCWGHCGHKGGLCENFCGGAYCCRYGVEDGDGVCDGTIGDPNNADHHVCWEGKNVGQQCWNDCGGSGDCYGNNGFCGSGACCKFGLNENNGVCDGTVGDSNNLDHHVCWPAPKNIGKHCWGECGGKGGICTKHCGSGMCCRFGVEEDWNGCDGAMGDPDQQHHVCSSVIAKKENNFCEAKCAREYKLGTNNNRICRGEYVHNGNKFGGCVFEIGSLTACSKSCDDAKYGSADETNACKVGCNNRFPCADGYTYKKDDVPGHGYAHSNEKNCQACAEKCSADDGTVETAADVFEGTDAEHKEMCLSYECTANAQTSSCSLNREASGGGKQYRDQIFCQKMTTDAVETETKTDSHKGIVAKMADGITCTAYSKTWGYLQMDQTRCNGIPAYIMIKLKVSQIVKDLFKNQDFECKYITDWSFFFGCPKGVCTLEFEQVWSLDACAAIKMLLGGALEQAGSAIKKVMDKYLSKGTNKSLEKMMKSNSNKMEEIAKSLDNAKKQAKKKIGKKNYKNLKKAGSKANEAFGEIAQDRHGDSLEDNKFACEEIEDTVRGILGCFGVNYKSGGVPGLSRVIEIANKIFGRIMFVTKASLVFVIDKLSFSYGAGIFVKWELSVLALVTRSVLTIIGKFVLDPKNAPGCDPKAINNVAWATSFKFEILPKWKAQLVVKCRPATFFGLTPEEIGKAIIAAKDFVVKKFGEAKDFVVNKIKDAWKIYGPGITAGVKRLTDAAKKFGKFIGDGARHVGRKIRDGFHHAGRKIKEGFHHAANRIKGWFGRRRHMLEMSLADLGPEEYLSLIESTEAGFEEELAYTSTREERLAEVEEFLAEVVEFRTKSLVMSEEQLSDEDQIAMEEQYIEEIMTVADHHVQREMEEAAAAEAEEEIAENIIPEEEWTEQELNAEILEELVARLMEMQD